MLQSTYLAEVRSLLDRLEESQSSKVDMVAEVVAEAVATGHGFFVSPLGHGNEGDLLNRAGGLMLLRPFNFSFNVNSGVAEVLRSRPAPPGFDADLEAARVAVRQSPMREGDCLIVGSVSGRTPRPVSTAIAAREIGVKVIAITSMEYTKQTEPAHLSGKLLYEVADYVLDNCVPAGDACLEVPGLAVKAFPLSGLGTITVAWMLCAQVIEKLIARGLPPHVYMSANRPEGPEFNKAGEAEFNRLGY